MSECIGLTTAEAEAWCIAAAAQFGYTGEQAEVGLSGLIASGLIKRCSKHPDHYIVNRKWDGGVRENA